jgi:hypothetical protein
VTADRSTVQGWLRDLEKAADEHSEDPTYRAWVFRNALTAAWQDGHGRGYDDCRDDHDRAAAAARLAAREAAAARPAAEES